MDKTCENHIFFNNQSEKSMEKSYFCRAIQDDASGLPYKNKSPLQNYT